MEGVKQNTLRSGRAQQIRISTDGKSPCALSPANPLGSSILTGSRLSSSARSSASWNRVVFFVRMASPLSFAY